MHSFQPSRGRILFEVFCTLGAVASFVGAWKQTGASALLAAAAVAGLYSFVRLFDLLRHDPPKVEQLQRVEFEPEAALPAYESVVVPLAAAELPPTLEETIERQRIEFEPEAQDEGPAYQSPVVPLAMAELQPATEIAVEETELVEPVASRARAPRQAKAPRKSGGRRAKAAKEAKVAEFVPPEESEVFVPIVAEEPELAEFAQFEEETHPHIAPLFEPATYVHARQQRAAFGRKAR